MNKQTLLIAGIIFAAALLALGVLLVLPPPPSAKPLSETEKPEPATAASSLGSGSSLVGTAKTKTVEPLAAATPSSSAAAPASAPPLTQKEAILVEIDDAIVTYSPEGVGIITPYLSNSDRELRSAAVEGLKQLGEPEGAKVLRRMARSVTDPRTRQEFLEAAEFIELPPVEVEWVQP